MGYGEELRRIVEEAGLEVKALAARAGVSRVQLHNIMAGHDPKPATVAKIQNALAQVAAIVAPTAGDATPHPGATDLAADADLRDAYRVSEEELAGLRDVVIVWRGKPVVMRTKWGAVALLEAVRRIVREPE